MKCEILENPENGKLIKTLEDIPFTLNGKDYVVPRGFTSNGCSVPRFLWSLLSPAIDNTTIKASCVHDYLYQKGICTRLEADEFYKAQLLKNGFPNWKANLVYVGVRAGGYSHWLQK